ncbi:hypothetical protein [Leptotrichia wadei]|jgi:hypothetical protein|uniref:hypothetical protein n=1 Tax=Leptotrichia wadei TaxID=157687 RepID=UPI0020477ADA|nr:hypothetical protein [Leptotrichia wadei]DAI45270.1 MAG TPA: hypothetical protein [Caudoviricetes sp.]
MNDFTNTVVKINLFDSDDKIISSGTGFFYSIPVSEYTNSLVNVCLPCIITSKHLFNSNDISSYEVLLQSIYSGSVSPEYLKFNLNDIIKVDHPVEDLTLLYLKNVKLKMSIGYLQPTYIKYPHTAIRHNFISESYIVYSKDTIERSKFIFSEYGETVHIPGYHLGKNSYDINNPINVTGVLSTNPLSNKFVLQAPLNNGSSGSPVFFHVKNNYTGNVQSYLIGIITEYVDNADGQNTGLVYAVSSRNIYLLEQLILAEINFKNSNPTY